MWLRFQMYYLCLTLKYKDFAVLILRQIYIQSDLCTTTTFEFPNLWPLLTGGRCSEVVFCFKDLQGLQDGGGCYSGVVIVQV